ncbi:MAG: pyridoxine 5'-phosphate synthase [Halobacteriovorax sp.]|nr:pyridoxine 5'-phosphate synthase [Halobacteriovorax sp.]|tara:strand:+ start:52268 stop:53023 length:756 start_codon:yes stop_codon:yes gene_type:complete
MTTARLGINIDHVATLRQQRGEEYPSMALAARTVLENGADQITIHLREDRRHIQDADVPVVKKICDEFSQPLNFEMGCHPEIIKLAIKTSPAWVCLVPEKREERTTEGGLDLIDPDNFRRVREATEKIRKEGIMVSLFVEADLATLEKANELGVEAVEIHTGDYARDFQDGRNLTPHLEKFYEAKNYLDKYEIGCHAGHGLTDLSTETLLKNKLFVEYNIGHWIICQSVFEGLGRTTEKLVDLFKKYPVEE